MRITLNFELQKQFTTFQQFPGRFFLMSNISSSFWMDPWRWIQELLHGYVVLYTLYQNSRIKK